MSIYYGDDASDLAGQYERDQQAYQSVWDRQQQRYTNAWRYFSGEVFNEKVETSSNPNESALLFPLRVNTIRYTVLRHALHLWGQYSDNIIEYRVRPLRNTVDSAQTRARNIEKVLSDFIQSNQGVNRLRDAARLFIIFGGVFFKLSRNENHPLGVSLTHLSPEYVYPVWNPSNYDHILRAHIVQPIDVEVARLLYGYKGNEKGGELVDLVETWTEERWQVFIAPRYSNAPIHVAIDRETGRPLGGPNDILNPITKQRIIPLVYVPRFRTGEYYGLDLIQDIQGLQDEFNGRLADTGEAVNQASKPSGWGHDLSGRKDKGPIRLQAGYIYDAGETVVGREPPFITGFPGPEISEGLGKFNDKLEALLWDYAGISPVMMGKDEGSQRSAATLNVRALPTTSLIEDYRAAWGQQLANIAEIFLIICQGSKLNGIDMKDLGHDIEVKFAPILPKDREAIVNEVVSLRGAGLISLHRAVSLLPDVRDVDEEVAAIEKEEEEERELEEERLEAQTKSSEEQQEKKFEHDEAMQSKKAQEAKALRRPTAPKK